MRILHILTNNKFGGTQILADSFSRAEGIKNVYFFLDDPIKGYFKDSLIDGRNICLKGYVDKSSYDLIITYNGLGILRKLSGVRTKILVHVGSKITASFKYVIYSVYYNLFCQDMIIVAPSRTVLNSLKRVGFRKAFLVSNPIRKEFFLPRFRVSDSKMITMVGRIDRNDEARNWRLFCEMSSVYPEKKFNAVGEGNLLHDLKKAYPQINFHGSLQIKELIALLDESRFYLFLNNTIEGFGIALYEALSRGCIVIVPNIAINREIVVNRVNGFTYAPGDLKNVLSEVFQMPKNVLDEVSKNGKASIQSYAEDIYVDKILTLVEDC